jgi:hypothetical protein
MSPSIYGNEAFSERKGERERAAKTKEDEKKEASRKC